PPSPSGVGDGGGAALSAAAAAKAGAGTGAAGGIAAVGASKGLLAVITGVSLGAATLGVTVLRHVHRPERANLQHTAPAPAGASRAMPVSSEEPTTVDDAVRHAPEGAAPALAKQRPHLRAAPSSSRPHRSAHRLASQQAPLTHKAGENE